MTMNDSICYHGRYRDQCRPCRDSQSASDFGPLFEAVLLKEDGIRRGLAGQSEAAKLLEPVILQLAIDAGAGGITADDVRRKADEMGIRPDSDDQRAWSFLAGLFARLRHRGDLIQVGRRRSSRRGAHQNELRVYVHRMHAEAA